jgi:hypothetical protein
MRSKKTVRAKHSMNSDIKRLSGSLTHGSMMKEPSLRKLHARPTQIEEALPHRYKTGGEAKREHHGFGELIGNQIGARLRNIKDPLGTISKFANSSIGKGLGNFASNIFKGAMNSNPNASGRPMKTGGSASRDCGKGRYEAFLKDSHH